MKTKTLLAIGNWRDFDTYRKFYLQRRFFYGSKIAFKKTSYEDILDGNFPKIKTKELIIFPFFPYKYWDEHIEPKDYKGVYGNRDFYTKFVKFWKIFEKSLNEGFKDKKIVYINHPKYLATDRDKEITKKLVSRNKVLVPKTYTTRKVSDILSLLNKGKKLFIKVKFGSMGKGITMLEKDRWMTNFRFRAGKIISKKSDYGWTFIDVTGKKDFLRELLKKDIIVEDAIDPLIVKGKKFDMRFYVYKNKVLYSYGRTTAASNVTTNISQGARGEKPSFVKLLPEKQFENAKKSAINSLKALGLNFGGVDLMFCSNKKDVMFIEVNTFPGFPKVRRFNLSRLLIKELIKDY